jgi:hypothetical protein
VCVVQGPKGELSWTFVPEVTLKEVCCLNGTLGLVWPWSAMQQALRLKHRATISCSSGGSSDSSRSRSSNSSNSMQCYLAQDRPEGCQTLFATGGKQGSVVAMCCAGQDSPQSQREKTLSSCSS